jgi:hypothetical protein
MAPWSGPRCRRGRPCRAGRGSRPLCNARADGSRRGTVGIGLGHTRDWVPPALRGARRAGTGLHPTGTACPGDQHGRHGILGADWPSVLQRADAPGVAETTVSSTVAGVTGPDATGPSPATIGPYDVPGMPGGLPAACCSAGTSSSTRRPRGSPGPPSRPCSRQVRPPGSRAGRQRAAGGSSVTFRFRCSLSCSDPPRPRTRRSRLPYLQPGDLD